MKTDELTPLLDSKVAMLDGPPAGPFAAALVTSADDGHDAKPVRLPQAIAHRGYKAAFPENSMAAFRSAVEIGAHAIETDLHLSRDGVVVLSHDATLKRCFGEDTKVADCDWSYLSTLLTTREPRQPLPRLVELLEYLAQPGQEHMWLLLDIKRDDDPGELLSRLATSIASVPSKKPWTERIMVGCWNANYVKLSLKLLSGFPLAFIGWDLAYASALFPVPNMNFNLFAHSVAGPCGDRFLRKAKRNNRAVFVWTVNDVSWMEWSISKDLDGVITDDPKLFLQVCDRWKKKPNSSSIPAESDGKRRFEWTMKQLGGIMIFYILLVIGLIVFRVRHGTPKAQVRKALGYLKY